MDAMLNWFVNKPTGRATAALLQVAGSYALAKSGATTSWGISVHADPNVVFGGVFWCVHAAWAKWRHLVIEP